MQQERDIIHLDLDAFYPSVEALDNPGLRGKPVIVGGGRQRGVVSSASYEARRFGVHSAQPVARAERLCPHGIFLPVRMGRYREVSERVFAIFQRFTPLVEPLSLDEAFLDVTGSTRLFGSPAEVARNIKVLVQQEIGLTISAGVGPSKLVAKIASDLQKPDGLTLVPRGQVRSFLAPLPVEKLWGVGAVTHRRLLLLGVRTIGDLARAPAALLERHFGTQGIQLRLLARGEDDRDVVPDREAKSIGNEETFSHDLLDPERIRAELLALSVNVARRARRDGLAARTVTLKVKYHDFRQITRGVTVQDGLDDSDAVFSCLSALLEKTEAGSTPVRLLGVTLSQLEAARPRQPSLFSGAPASQKKKRLNAALDSITERFGDRSILPGTLLEKGGADDE